MRRLAVTADRRSDRLYSSTLDPDRRAVELCKHDKCEQHVNHREVMAQSLLNHECGAVGSGRAPSAINPSRDCRCSPRCSLGKRLGLDRSSCRFARLHQCEPALSH
jgi:hypothetical protein